MSTAKKTKPELWSRKVAAAKAKFGKWSARAAQWATAEYKKAGGGYSGAKKSSNSLSKWTSQKWRTRDGKKAERTDSKGRKVTARYLPDSAWKSLSKSEAKATDAKKRAGSKKGKGTVANTRKAKGAGRRARR
jgi:hypothetical protein